MTNPGESARDVIARELVVQRHMTARVYSSMTPKLFLVHPDADAILAALDDAGYDVVKRDQPLPPTPGPFNPFGKQDGEDQKPGRIR